MQGMGSNTLSNPMVGCNAQESEHFHSITPLTWGGHLEEGGLHDPVPPPHSSPSTGRILRVLHK